MPDRVFLIAAALTLLIAGLLLRRAIRERRLLRVLTTIQPTAIARLQAGFQQAKGVARSNQPIPSPFHRRPCMYYAYRVEDQTPGEPRPRRLAVGKDWAPLILEDETGTVDIEHRTALIQAPHENVTRLGALRAIPPEHAEFFEAAGIDAKHLPRFHDVTVTEYTLEDGDEIHVLGTLGPVVAGKAKAFYRARHSPFAVTPTADAGLIPGLKNELLLFSLGSLLLAAFGILFLGIAFA